MKPFEQVQKDMDTLKDAHNRRLHQIFTPDEQTFAQFIQTASELQKQAGDFLVISNAEALTEDEIRRESLRPGMDAAFIELSDLLLKLTGKSELSPKPNGFSLGQCIEALSPHCFVQATELTVGNIKSCLEDGGEILAYFPEDLWRCFYETDYAPGVEIRGFKAIRILDTDLDAIQFEDPEAASPVCSMDADTFQWLSKDGWMLEVYK